LAKTEEMDIQPRSTGPLGSSVQGTPSISRRPPEACGGHRMGRPPTARWDAGGPGPYAPEDTAADERGHRGANRGATGARTASDEFLRHFVCSKNYYWCRERLAFAVSVGILCCSRKFGMEAADPWVLVRVSSGDRDAARRADRGDRRGAPGRSGARRPRHGGSPSARKGGFNYSKRIESIKTFENVCVPLFAFFT